MKRNEKPNIFILSGWLIAGVLFFGLALPHLAAAYSVDISLTGGEAAARAELTEIFGAEGTGWAKEGGEFTSAGYLLGASSTLQIKLPDDLPVGHVKIKYEAQGIEQSVAGVAGSDGYMFSIWKEWCNPCPATGYDATCDDANWGFGIKKWPGGMGHPYSNSILVQGAGMRNGTAAPGAGVGDRFNWSDYTGFYTVELDLHAATSNGLLSVWKGDPASGGVPVLNSPGGVPYGLLNNSNRDGLMISLGAEAPGGPSYVGVTLRNVQVLFEAEAAPAEHPTYPSQCEESADEGDYSVCACVGGSPSAPIPCEDPRPAGDKEHATFLDQFPFGFDGWGIEWNWTFDDVMKEMDAKERQDQNRPEIGLQFAPPAPTEGEQVGAIAVPSYFRTRPNNLYYSWCLVDDDKVWPMNSVVAGGTRPENASDKTFSEKGCCGPITRTPAEDTDNDGMDDNWEREKFIGRAGTNYQTIADVRPGDDPDSDGFSAVNFANENGQYLTVAPAMVDSRGNHYIPGITGNFPNIMEYIAGTDPMNGDTDGDGNGDEMDYVGVGQSNVMFMIEKPSGPNGYYDIGVSAVGVGGDKRPVITSTKQRLFIGNDAPLKVTLTASDEVLTIGSDKPITINAVLEEGPTENQALFYEWSFNGDSACDGRGYENEELCNTGKEEIIIGAGGVNLLDLPPPTSEYYSLGVKVTSPASRDQAEATLPLAVAYAVTLTTVCNGQTAEISSLPADGDQALAVCIAEIEDIAQTYELSELNFVWSLDGENQQNQSGFGKTQFVLLPSGASGDSHILEVEVKDPNQAREFANGTRQFGVSGPRVAIIDPADRITYSDEVTPGATRYLAAQPGEAVPFGATQENFVGTAGWTVIWSVDGAESSAYSLSAFEPGEKHLFTFNVPANAETGQVYTIGFSVRAVDNDPPESAADSIKVVIGSPGANLGQANPFFSALAAVFNQVPAVFRDMVMYAGILAGVFFALVFIYPKASRFLENRQTRK